MQAEQLPVPSVHSDAKVVRLLRLYGLYAPWNKGQWRAAALLQAYLKRWHEDRDVIVRSRDGRRFAVDPREPQYWMGLIDRGVFEPDVTKAAAAVAFRGAVVVDAGANFGWFTTLFSRAVGPTGIVHAFEPMPRTAAALRANCRLNGSTNVVVNQVALGARAEQRQLFLTPGHACGDASLFAARPGEAGVACSVTTLDEYYESRRLTRCDVIKVDVEGAELMFLQGAACVIARTRPAILIEVNPETLRRGGTQPSDVLAELTRHGDYVFEIIDGDREAPRMLRPRDCDALSTYVNVLARVRSSRHAGANGDHRVE